jgi:hypothetical protein
VTPERTVNSDLNQLAVDLWHLRVAGLEFQDMGEVHTNAKSVVGSVDPSQALRRPDGVGWTGDGFLASWLDARDAVVSMLKTNADSLDDSGRALIWCADKLYAGADEDVRDRFDALNKADREHD